MLQAERLRETLLGRAPSARFVRVARPCATGPATAIDARVIAGNLLLLDERREQRLETRVLRRSADDRPPRTARGPPAGSSTARSVLVPPTSATSRRSVTFAK